MSNAMDHPQLVGCDVGRGCAAQDEVGQGMDVGTQLVQRPHDLCGRRRLRPRVDLQRQPPRPSHQTPPIRPRRAASASSSPATMQAPAAPPTNPSFSASRNWAHRASYSPATRTRATSSATHACVPCRRGGESSSRGGGGTCWCRRGLWERMIGTDGSITSLPRPSIERFPRRAAHGVPPGLVVSAPVCAPVASLRPTTGPDHTRNARAPSTRRGVEEERDGRLAIERLINKLRALRGIATRYDKTPDSCLAGLHPARLDDLDQRPHTDHPLITTRYAP